MFNFIRNKITSKNKHRLVRNKKTGKVQIQTRQYNGVEYVFLPINDLWEIYNEK